MGCLYSWSTWWMIGDIRRRMIASTPLARTRSGRRTCKQLKRNSSRGGHSVLPRLCRRQATIVANQLVLLSTTFTPTSWNTRTKSRRLKSMRTTSVQTPVSEIKRVTITELRVSGKNFIRILLKSKIGSRCSRASNQTIRSNQRSTHWSLTMLRSSCIRWASCRPNCRTNRKTNSTTFTLCSSARRTTRSLLRTCRMCSWLSPVNATRT